MARFVTAVCLFGFGAMVFMGGALYAAQPRTYSAHYHPVSETVGGILRMHKTSSGHNYLCSGYSFIGGHWKLVHNLLPAPSARAALAYAMMIEHAIVLNSRQYSQKHGDGFDRELIWRSPQSPKNDESI